MIDKKRERSWKEGKKFFFLQSKMWNVVYVTIIIYLVPGTTTPYTYRGNAHQHVTCHRRLYKFCK
jgi:hypothetical protein